MNLVESLRWIWSYLKNMWQWLQLLHEATELKKDAFNKLCWNMESYGMWIIFPRRILNMTHPTWKAMRSPQYSMLGSRIKNFRVFSCTGRKDNTDTGFVPWSVRAPGRRDQELIQLELPYFLIFLFLIFQVRMNTRLSDERWRKKNPFLQKSSK